MKKNRVSLLAVGDIMLGDHPICIGHGVGSKIRKKGSKFIFQHVKDKLKEGDIVFGNLEAVLSEKNLNKIDIYSASLRGHPSSDEGIVSSGFNILSIANNHIMRHSKEAFLENMKILKKYNIKCAGFLSNKASLPIIIEKYGIKLGFLAYSLRPEQTKNFPLYAQGNLSIIKNDINKIKSVVDFIIISLHWGDEFINRPSPFQQQMAREIIDSGANIILGHHPHVLQGVEKYHNSIIAYSLGNFVFDMWQKKMRESMILKIILCKRGIQDFEVIPIISNKNYQPKIITGENAKMFFLNRINKWSLDLMNEDFSNFDQKIIRYKKEAKKVRKEYRKELKIYFLTHFYKYKPSMMWQIICNRFKNK